MHCLKCNLLAILYFRHGCSWRSLSDCTSLSHLSVTLAIPY